MKLTLSVLQNIFRKYLCNRDFLEKYNAENLQDFAQTQLDFEFFLDNCHQRLRSGSNCQERTQTQLDFEFFLDNC